MYSVQLLAAFILICTVCVSSLNRNCGSEKDCGTDGPPVCGFDMVWLCFKKFPSRCHLDCYACQNNKVFKIYDAKYCQIMNFMCFDDYEKCERETPDDNLDDLVYGIYKTTPESPAVNEMS